MKKKIEDDLENILKMNKEVEDYFPVLETIKSINMPSYNDPCAGCSNNPKNNPYASGICGCTLPYMNNPTY